MADRLLLAGSATDGLILADASGVLLLAVPPPTPVETVTGSVTTGTPVTVTSWTPGANELVLVSVAMRATDITPTVAGNGLNFVVEQDVTNAQDQNRLVVFRAMGASPSTGSITVTATGNTNPIGVIATRFANVDTSGTDGSGACEASTQAAGPPVTDDNDMLLAVTTVTPNALAWGAGTYRSGLFTIPGGQTIIHDDLITGGVGGAEANSSTWYVGPVVTPASTTVGAANDLSTVRDWTMVAVSIKPAGGEASIVEASFTLDAVLTKTVSASFTLDAVLKREQTATSTLDAVLKREQVGSFTFDALIVKDVWVDTFTRTVSPGWGTPDLGAPYETKLGVPSVNGTVGLLSDSWVEGGRGIHTGVVQFDYLVTAEADNSAVLDVGPFSLEVSNSEGWGAYVRGSSTYATVLFSPGLDEMWTAKAWVGPAMARVKVWKTGDPEPDWGDNDATYMPETIGPSSVSSFSADTFDNIWVRTASTALAWTKQQFTLDAVIKREQTATFSLDAVLFETQGVSFALDAVLFKAQAATFTFDAVLRREQLAAFTLDAAIAVTSTAQLTLDAQLFRIQTASYTLDAVLYREQTAAFSLDAVTLTTASASFSLDAVLLRTTSASLTLDAQLFATQVSSLTLDAYLSRIFTLDACLLKTQTASFSLDAVIMPVFTLDSIFLRTQQASFSLDAFIPGDNTYGVTLDAVLLRTATSTFSTDALVKRTFDATLSFDAVIHRVQSASFTLDAVQLKTSEATATADAVIQATRTVGFTLDAVLLTLQQASPTLDAVLQTSSEATFALDAVLDPIGLTFSLDAVLASGAIEVEPISAIWAADTAGVVLGADTHNAQLGAEFISWTSDEDFLTGEPEGDTLRAT